MPIMAITTRSSTREKAGEEETGDRKAETGNGEGRGNSRGGAEARREGMIGADRRDARVEVDSKDGCGEPSLPLVDVGRTSKEGFAFWLGVIDRMI